MPERHRPAAQAAESGTGAAHPRRRKHYHLSQRHPYGGAGVFPGLCAGTCRGKPAGTLCLCPKAERGTPRGPVPAPGGAHQQPRKCHPAHPEPQCPGREGTVFQRELDAHGVCVSVKSACSSDGLPSRAVFAVSRDRRNALSSWRISLSHLTTEAEIQEFLRVFDVCCQQLTAAHGDR